MICWNPFFSKKNNNKIKKTKGKEKILIAPSWGKGNILDSCIDQILDNILHLKSEIIELNLSPTENLEEAGKNFYDYLHILDNSQCNGVAVAPIPNHNLGKTINDRLIRASIVNSNLN